MSKRTLKNDFFELEYLTHSLAHLWHHAKGKSKPVGRPERRNTRLNTVWRFLFPWWSSFMARTRSHAAHLRTRYR